MTDGHAIVYNMLKCVSRIISRAICYRSDRLEYFKLNSILIGGMETTDHRFPVHTHNSSTAYPKSSRMVVQSFNSPVISFFASHFSLLYLLGVVVGGWRSVLLLKSPPDSRTTNSRWTCGTGIQPISCT